MPTVITVERESPTHSSSRSNSFTDEGSSTDDQSWDPVYSDEIEPSESASRPRPSHYRRSDSRQPSVRRGPIRRHTATERSSHRPPLSRVHRHPAPNPPSSVDPQEDYPGYGRGFLPPNGAYGVRGPPPGYAPSFVSHSPNPFGGNAGQMMPYGGQAAYPYPQNPFSPAPAAGTTGYFPPSHYQAPGHAGPGYGGHEVMPYGQTPGYGYGAYGPQSQYYPHYAQTHPPSPREAPAAPAAPAPPAAAPAPAAAAEKSEVEKKLAAVEKLLEDAKLEAEKTKQEAERLRRETEEKKMASMIAAEKAKREAEEKKLAALERLLENTKHEAERSNKLVAERAAADKEAAAEAEEKKLAALQRLLEDTKHEAERSKKLVAERAAADKEAAAEAAFNEATDKKVKEEVAKVKAEADKKTKAAEDAKTKAEEEKKAADEAKAKAEADAKALAAPKDEKKAPIKFKDAVGRKFSFPFHLCQKWAGMEALIRQAFLHVDVIGPLVAEGHYDLVGPHGEIILPQVWETMIEPDWAITMHMWPLPERQKGPPEGAQVIDVGPGHRPVNGGRRRGDRPVPPPGRRGPPPVPPPWIGPEPDLADEIIVIEDNTTKSSKKKKPDPGGILSGLWGAGSSSKTSKPSGKGRSKKS